MGALAPQEFGRAQVPKVGARDPNRDVGAVAPGSSPAKLAGVHCPRSRSVVPIAPEV